MASSAGARRQLFTTPSKSSAAGVFVPKKRSSPAAALSPEEEEEAEWEESADDAQFRAAYSPARPSRVRPRTEADAPPPPPDLFVSPAPSVPGTPAPRVLPSPSAFATPQPTPATPASVLSSRRRAPAKAAPSPGPQAAPSPAAPRAPPPSPAVASPGPQAAPAAAAAAAAAAPAAPTPEELAAAEEESIVREIAGGINDVLVLALSVMLDAVAAVSYKLGNTDVRRALVYQPRGPPDVREDPLACLRIIDEGDPNLKTISYLIRVYQPKLGARFLQTYLKPWVEKQTALMKAMHDNLMQQGQVLIQDCFDFHDADARNKAFGAHLLSDRTVLNDLAGELAELNPNSAEYKAVALQFVREKAGAEAMKLLRQAEPHLAFAPAWAFEVVSSNVFRAFLAPAHLVAFELAHAQVIRIRGCETFTMKELICSKGVMDQFAWMVAYQYMDASKGLPMFRQKGAEKGERGIYVNINHMRETVQKRAYLCRIWFESVRAFPNPLLAEFEKHKAEEERRQTLLGNLDTPMKRTLFEASMQQYREMLPRRELKYIGQ